MRTTITLDDDIAVKLQQRARKTGQSFKFVVNAAIRTGLAVQANAKQLPPYKIKKEHLFGGMRSRLNFDKIEEVFDELDGADRLR